MQRFYRTGALYPLAERDSKGRQILFFNQPQIDPEIFTSDDVFHLFFTIATTLLLEEETQISGLSFVLNHKTVSMKYISLFSVEQFINLTKFLKNSSPGRFKSLYLVNVPAIGMFLWNAAIMALTEKLKDRIKLVKSMEDLDEFVEKSLLPKEFGGEKFSEAEMMNQFMRKFDNRLTQLNRTNEFDIDMKKFATCDENQDTVGSFRKLEID